MKECPDCGKEYTDDKEFCTECGTTLEAKAEPPRNSITENLRFAFKLAGSNFKIFYPHLVYVGGGIVLGIALLLYLGVGFYGYTGSEVPSFPTGLILIFIIVWIGGMYLGLISTPFLQHVYKTAVIGEEISFRESFKFGRGMFLPYLGAFLAMIVLITVSSIILIFVFPPSLDLLPDIMQYPEELSYMMILRSMSWVLGLIPFVTFYSLAYTLMAWDKISLIPALKATYHYVRERFVDLLVLGVLGLISGVILMEVPFGGLISTVLTIVFNLALIDNYLNYQLIATAGHLATGSEAEP